jgi:hypothetical protein
MTSLETKFETLAAEWSRHCESVLASSNMADYLRHPAYAELAKLGPGAVPLIMKRFDKDEFLPWEFVLQEITGIQRIADPGNFSPREVRQAWVEWWQKGGSRHFSGK